MSNWAATIGTYFGENSWQILAVALVFGLLAFVRSIADFAWNQKDRRITHLKNALDINELSEDVKFVLTEDINRSLFMKVTGIPTDQYTRQVYVELLKKSEGELTINQLRRGSQFLTFEDKKISVSKSSGRKFGYFLEKWYPWVLVVASFAQIIVMIIRHTPSLFWVQLSLVIGCLVIAGILKRQSINYEVALHIEELFKENNDKSDESNERVKSAA